MSSKIKKIYKCFITLNWNSKENVWWLWNTGNYYSNPSAMKLKTSLIRQIFCQMKLKTSLNYSIQQQPSKLSSPLKFHLVNTNFNIRLFIQIQYSTQWHTTLLLNAKQNWDNYSHWYWSFKVNYSNLFRLHRTAFTNGCTYSRTLINNKDKRIGTVKWFICDSRRTSTSILTTAYLKNTIKTFPMRKRNSYNGTGN